MGRKAAIITMSLGAVVAIITIVAFCLPLYSLSIFSTLVRLMRMEISFTWVNVRYLSASTFCEDLPNPNEAPDRAQGYSGARRNWCLHAQQGESTVSTQDIAFRVCSPSIEWVWPSLCAAMNAAYLYGLVLLLVCIMNSFIIQGVAGVLLYYYAMHQPRKRLRQAIVTLISLGLFSLFTAVAGYIFVTTSMLDSAQGGNRMNILVSRFFLSSSDGVGVDWGCYVLLAVCTVQLVQLLCCQYLKTVEEEDNRKPAMAGGAEHVDYGATEESSLTFGGATSAGFGAGDGFGPGAAGASPWGATPSQAAFGGPPAAGGAAPPGAFGGGGGGAGW